MDPETAFATHGIITTILANLPRTAPLEYIAFGARAMGPKNGALWSRIGYLAERVEFLRLKEIAFDLYPSPIAGFEGWEKYIRMHLPDCDARDILRVRASKVGVRWICDNFNSKCNSLPHSKLICHLAYDPPRPSGFQIIWPPNTERM
jgi:hypothetical protein